MQFLYSGYDLIHGTSVAVFELWKVSVRDIVRVPLYVQRPKKKSSCTVSAIMKFAENLQGIIDRLSY